MNFVAVRALVFQEVRNPEVLNPFHFVLFDKPLRLKLINERRDVYIVERKNLSLDPFRAVFQAPFAVCKHPQPREQKAGRKRAFRKLFVFIESRLYVSCAHDSPSKAFYSLPNPSYYWNCKTVPQRLVARPIGCGFVAVGNQGVVVRKSL